MLEKNELYDVFSDLNISLRSCEMILNSPLTTDEYKKHILECLNDFVHSIEKLREMIGSFRHLQVEK